MRWMAFEARRWQRIRRLGQWRFVLLLIVLFWSVMVAHFFLAAWIFLPSFEALDQLPPDFYRKLALMVPLATIALYFAGRYAWRVNERKYPSDDRA